MTFHFSPLKNRLYLTILFKKSFLIPPSSLFIFKTGRKRVGNCYNEWWTTIGRGEEIGRCPSNENKLD